MRRITTVVGLIALSVLIATPARSQTEPTPRLYLPLVTLWLPVLALPNGDFEQGPIVWGPPGQAAASITQSPPIPPRSGTYVAWLLAAPDAQNTAIDSSAVTVPSDRPYLAFWAWIESAEPTCGVDFAGVSVLVDDGQEAVDQFDLCVPTQTDEWRQRTVDLRRYAGRAITVELFVTTFNEAHASSMYVDDVAFQVSP